MARLKVADPPQHGYRTGGATTAPAAAGASAPTPESPPRRRAPKPSIKKKRVSLTPNRQATLAVEYAGLPKPKAERNRALDGLCRKYGCNSHYPRQMVSGLSLNGKLPLSRKGKAGRNPRITVAGGDLLLRQTLHANAYDLTFRQVEEKTGFPKSTVQRWMKKNKWRVVGKSTRPILTDTNIGLRKEWAQEHLNNNWDLSVDIDEKWFYVYSQSGKLKLPPGVEKPKQKIKSKRFIGKVMMLCAIARPCERHDFDGLVGCWRVCEQRAAKRGDSRTGLKKGDMITEDVTMTADKFESMMRRNVIPAIRSKLSGAPLVKIQMDNASPHKSNAAPGKDTMLERLADVLAAPKRGRKVVGPKIEFVRQIPNSPDTNACDLGFFLQVFKSMDSHLPRCRSFKLDEFADQCYATFAEYPSEKLTRLFDTKKLICGAILANEGNNEYKMPHRRDNRA